MKKFQYGFSCEFLDPAEILRQGVPRMMKEHEFGLFLKVFDDGLDEDYKKLLQALVDNDVYEQFFPWPLLKVEDGYYPNELTVDKFRVQVAKLLDWTKENGFDAPPYILVDLEPSTDPNEAKKAEELRKDQLKKLRDDIDARKSAEGAARAARETLKKDEKSGGGGPDVMSFVGKLIDMIDENVDEARFMAASEKFNGLVEEMHDAGTKALAVALPQCFDDLKDGKHLIQDFMTVPVNTVDWDLINFMVFSTDFVQKTKGIISHDEFLHLAYSYCRDFKEYYEPKGTTPSICFGITNYGVQDTSAIQVDPKLYRREFDAAIAAGVDQLGIYALEGVLANADDPEGFIMEVGSATGDFTPNAEGLELASNVRRIFEALDYVAPVLKYLVDSGKVMQIIQAVAGGKGLF
ncbi:MAG: hypothetical protein ACTSU5_04130 [Promethearchaeota archaeon]